jgi:hypothetical protein
MDKDIESMKVIKNIYTQLLVGFENEKHILDKFLDGEGAILT